MFFLPHKYMIDIPIYLNAFSEFSDDGILHISLCARYIFLMEILLIGLE